MTNLVAGITAVSWCFGGVAILVVSIRLYTRVLLTRRAGLDDIFITISLASAIVCSALAQVGVHYGLGRHMRDIADPEAQIQAFKYTVIAPNFSVVSTTTGKISVSLFLLRLMGHTATVGRKVFLYGLNILSIGWNVLAIIAIIGFCRPPQKLWRPEMPGSCFSLRFQLIAGTSQAAFNGLVDLILALFPVYMFWNVQLPLQMKLAVIAVLGAGLLAAAATIVKAVLLKNLPAHSDITWSWASITLWYSIEMYVIIICATLPTLRQAYFAVFFPARLKNSYYSKFSRSGKSERRGKSIQLVHRGIEGSLFETTNVDDDRPQHSDSSRENILPEGALAPGNVVVTKTTEFEIHENRRPEGNVDGSQAVYSHVDRFKDYGPRPR